MSVVVFIWATGLAVCTGIALYGAPFAPRDLKFRSVLIGLLLWPVTLTKAMTKAIAMLRK